MTETDTSAKAAPLQNTITCTIQQDDGKLAAEGGDGVTGLAPAPNGTL